MTPERKDDLDDGSPDIPLSDGSAGSTLDRTQLRIITQTFPHAILEAYGSHLDYILERKQGTFPSFLEASPEFLQHYLFFIEAFIKAGVSDIPLLETSPHARQILHAIVQYKIVFEEGERLSPHGQQLSLEQMEKYLASEIGPQDMLFLFKVGEDGGETYAPLVSKMLHALRHGTNFGKESKEDFGHALDIFRETFLECVHSDVHAVQRLACRQLHHQKFTTPQQKISATSIYLFAHYQPEQSLADLYEKEFPTLVKMLVEIFLQSFYTRDHEQITEANVDELKYAIWATIRAKFSEEQNQEGVSAEVLSTEATRMAEAIFDSMPSWLKDNERFSALFGTPKFAEDPGKDAPLSLTAVLTPRILATSASSFKNILHSKDLTKLPLAMARLTAQYGGALAHLPFLRTVKWAYELYVSNLYKRAPRGLRDTRSMFSEQVFGLSVSVSDTPLELSHYAEQTFTLRDGTPQKQTGLQVVFEKIEQHPEYLTTYVQALTAIPFSVLRSADNQTIVLIAEDSTSFLFFRTLFTKDRLERKPEWFRNFIALLIQPDFKTFYNACCIAADLIGQEGRHFWFSVRLLVFLFRKEQHFIDPVRLAVLRNIAERLPEEAKQKLIKIILRLASFPADQELCKKMYKLLGSFGEMMMEKQKNIYQAQQTRERKKSAKEAKETKSRAPLELLQGLPQTPYTERNLQDTIREIIEHRTIELSHDGHDVNFTNSISSLKEIFSRGKIRRNKETGNPPEGLACNVTLFTKDGLPLYCRLGIDGGLAIRLLDEHGQVKEEISRNNISKFGISASSFDELHFFILEVLHVIYVRNITPLPPETPPPASQTSSAPPTSSGEGGVVFTADTTMTHERVVGRMKIDLTEGDLIHERRKSKEERVRIGTNREKVLRIFSSLARGGTLDETLSPEVSELMLYECVVIQGQQFFSPMDASVVYNRVREGILQPQDVYIRTGRAHAKPLPYVKYERRTDNDPSGNSYYVVRKKRRSAFADLRRESFMRDEHGESLDVSGKRGILYFDVENDPDNTVNMQLFERMRSGQDIPGFIRTLEMEMHQRLEAIRGGARAKYLETDRPDPMRYAEIMGRTERITKTTFEAAKNTLTELPHKVVQTQEKVEDLHNSDSTRMRIRLGLPQGGFEFDQTFNHGEFRSLQELLDKLRPKANDAV